MPSFNGLYTVRSGLFATQRALELIGQNVSNANTVGYSRQEVAFVSAEPGQVIHSAGRGIADAQIVRYRDEFLDRQYRTRAGAQGYYHTLSNSLSQVEEILGDLSSSGIRSAMDEFFNKWENLAMNPRQSDARILVVDAAEHFLGMAHTAFEELKQLRQNIDDAMQLKVDQVNAAAQQIADLNQRILAGEVSGSPVNNLLDRRDMLVDSLAKLAGATSVRHADGTVTVHVGSLPIVEKASAHPIDVTVALEPDMDPTGLTSTQQRTATLTWNGTTNSIKFGSGEIAALLELRDQAIPEQMKALDNLVRTVATEVNLRHQENPATPGVPDPTIEPVFLMSTSTWMDIRVNGNIKSDPSRLVPGYTGGASDGDRARHIAAIRDAKILTGAPVGAVQVTPEQYFSAIISDVGVQVQMAISRSESATMQMDQAEKQRQSVSGVSLDDEMTKMIQFQQAYNAAARVMTSIDEMLDTLVNRVGITGR